MYDRNEISDIEYVIDRVYLKSAPDQEIYGPNVVVLNMLPEEETRYQKAAKYKKEIYTYPAYIIRIVVKGLMSQYDQYDRNTT